MSGKFKKGDRVILSADEAEGWTEERGRVIEEELPRYPGMYLVQVPSNLDEGDDGLREVSEDQMQFDRS